jgi:uroporphyrinogen decarboxylase
MGNKNRGVFVPLTRKERVDRALRGEEVDRPPFTFWYHFRLHKFPGDRHAAATLDFHRRLRTDLVKVMSDFPYPRPAGQWYELRVDENPFPEQIRALELIRDGLAGQAYFVETLFNPWNMAEKLSSPADVLKLMSEKPQALLDALEAIAKSQINHARRAIEIGASGIFLAVGSAQDGILSPADYAKFSEPFDRMILEAVQSSPLNVLHLHGDKLYFEPFYSGWQTAVVNYSIHGTGMAMADVRRRYSGVLMGGLDEVNFGKLTAEQLKEQWQSAQAAAGKRFILSPGCSVPDDTADEELLRLVNILDA